MDNISTKSDTPTNTDVSPEMVREFVMNNKDLILHPEVNEDSKEGREIKPEDNHSDLEDFSFEDAKNMGMKIPTSNISTSADSKDEQIYKHKRELITDWPIEPVSQKSDYLIDLSKIKATDDEKADYLRSVLSDQEFWLTVRMLSGKVSFNLRSKTVNELSHINRYLTEMIEKDKHIDTNTLMQEMCKINIAVQLDMHSDIYHGDNDTATNIEFESNYDTFMGILRKRISYINKLSSMKWLMLINAIRIFDEKFSQLSEMVINEDF